MTSRDINKHNLMKLKMTEQTRLDRLMLEWKRQADQEVFIAFISLMIMLIAGYFIL